MSDTENVGSEEFLTELVSRAVSNTHLASRGASPDSPFTWVSDPPLVRLVNS